MDVNDLLRRLGLDPELLRSGDLPVCSPIDGGEIAVVMMSRLDEITAAVADAETAFATWRVVPAPRRGTLIRLFGEELRAHQEALGELVTIETGKIREEGLGEVQEMIDICDFAVGLSRQLYGLTIVSERPGHRMMETWHPLGPVGVITAFNFPVAVWSWNFTLAIVSGDPVVWKPSDKTPLTAFACQALFVLPQVLYRVLPERFAAPQDVYAALDQWPAALTLVLFLCCVAHGLWPASGRFRPIASKQ